MAWTKWEPYLSERQWRTVREDYSQNGNAWDYFPYSHSGSRAYIWGEDGLAKISDVQQLLACTPVWVENPSCDNFLAYRWQTNHHANLLIIVNYAVHQRQCRIILPNPEITNETIHFIDLLGTKTETLKISSTDGLFFDLPAWGYYVLEFDSKYSQ